MTYIWAEEVALQVRPLDAFAKAQFPALMSGDFQQPVTPAQRNLALAS